MFGVCDVCFSFVSCMVIMCGVCSCVSVCSCARQVFIPFMFICSIFKVWSVCVSVV